MRTPGPPPPRPPPARSAPCVLHALRADRRRPVPARVAKKPSTPPSIALLSTYELTYSINRCPPVPSPRGPAHRPRGKPHSPGASIRFSPPTPLTPKDPVMARKPSKCVELLPKPAAEAITPLRESYTPFPAGLLPPVLAGYVREGARALGCDAACLALPVLAAAASAVGNTRVLRLKPGWDEPSVLWAVVVGEGGAADVAAFRKAVAYLVKLQRTHLAEFRGRSAIHKNAAIARNAARRRAGGERLDLGDVPRRPPLNRHVCDDTFVEALAEILETNH